MECGNTEIESKQDSQAPPEQADVGGQPEHERYSSDDCQEHDQPSRGIQHGFLLSASGERRTLRG